MNSNFITNLARYIQTRYDLKKEELTVVFPNKRAAYYLRSKFREIYEEDVWLPQMLSVEEAMTRWSRLQLVDTVDMLFELIAIDSELYDRENHIRVFGSMAAQMAKDFDEIDQYGVDASHLFSYVYETKRIGAWELNGSVTPKEEQHLLFFKNLERYYDLLRERLERQGKGYYGMITRGLATMDDRLLLERIGQRKVVFAGFNALTPTEQTVIEKLYRNGCAEVVWDFDRYYVEDPNNEAGHFARSYIEKNVGWKPTRFSDSLLTEPKEIHFIGADGKTIQTKALQSLLQVKDEVNSAVILADEQLLIPMLNAIPDEPRYASLKVSMGYPLRDTTLTHLITNFFTLQRKGRKVRNEGWYLWPILRILDLELIQVIFSRQELEQLRAFRSYVAERSAFIFNADDFARYCPSQDLKTFMHLLLCDGDNTPNGLLDALVALLAFIAQQVQRWDVSGKDNFLLNQVSEAGKTVNRLKGIVSHYDHYVDSTETLEILFRIVMSNISVKLNSDNGNGLQIMGLLEARNLDFDTYYMVGVNDGVLPAEKSYSSFIPYFIRKECGLPDEHEKQAVYAYHFYRQLQGAKKAYFIYDSNGANAGGEPSRFLLQLQYELARRNPNVIIKQEAFATPTTKAVQADRIVIHKTDRVMEPLMQKIQTQELHKALAPTSISAYVRCPLLFCLRYIMKIRDNSVTENTPDNVIGTVIHDTLQLLYEGYCGDIITPEVLAHDIKPAVEPKMRQAIAKQFAQGLPNVGYNYINQLTINKLLDNYLRFETAEVAQHTLSVLTLEHTLHTTLTVDGITCVIAGKADRIDRRDGIVRIIDYKTGHVGPSDVRVPKEVVTPADIPDKAMQLLIYKYLYLKEHPEVHPDAVSASLFGLRQRQVALDLRIDYPALNEDFIATMDRLLVELLASMMDRSLAFEQPNAGSDKPCRYCEFKDICVSTAAGASLEDGR